MDPALITAPPRAEAQTRIPAAPAAHPEARPGRDPARVRLGIGVALGGLLVVSLGLRLWGVKQGLPYSYNSDEATHFVPKAIAFLGHDFNPHYFLNPPGYTYLLYVVFVLWFGGGHGVHTAFATDPAAVFVVARVVAAVLGTAAVGLVYLAAGRLFGRLAGWLAAAVLGLAFLPVFYSHLALNDAPVLAPVALALYGVAVVLRPGVSASGAPKPALGYVLSGLGIGLATATKYTGGITLLCLLGAFACDGAAAGWRPAARRLALALAVALAAFLMANPYAALDSGAFFSGISAQSSLVQSAKLGAHPRSGLVYYLWSLTWGFGWAPSLAAAAGAGLLVTRRTARLAITLVPAPVAFLIFMGLEGRSFGRWLMPILPILAMLAGLAGVRAVAWVGRGRRLHTAVAGGVAIAALLAQSMLADIHDDRVLSRPDTRNLARTWMLTHIPAGAKVVIEPVVPANWEARWRQYPTWLTHLDGSGHPLPGRRTRPIHIDQYERYLYPSLLSAYVSTGYCWVVTGSQQQGRAFVDPAQARGAIAYYRALSRRGRLAYRVSPYGAGGRPPSFSFDWSFDYYPGQDRLPGPAIRIYRLRGGKCGP